MGAYKFIIVLSVIIQIAVCEIPRNEYTGLRKYYKVRLGLTSIPTDIPKDALEVYIKYNPITRITAGVFSQLSECTILDLYDNQISEVDAEAFYGLTALTELQLSKNRLEHITVKMFSGLRNCTVLKMEYNQINEIESGTFNDLMALEELSIQFNMLQSIHINVFNNLPNCKKLNLNNNSISEIEPESFTGMSNLGSLSLKNNKLTSLAAGSFAGLGNAQLLELDNNRLTSVEPGSFNGLSYVRLSLTNNKLTTLKDDMFVGLEAVHSLDLSNNVINYIHDKTFSTLRQLVRLFLDGNELDALNEQMFAGLDSLRFLSIERNRLTTLPATVFNLIRNRRLSVGLRFNPLVCDSELCWLKQEESQDNIYFYDCEYDLDVQPTCEYGIDWDSCTCDVTGIMTCSSVAPPEQPPTVRTTTTASLGPLSFGTMKWISIAGGVVLVLATIVIFLICLKRCGIGLCRRSSTSVGNGPGNEPGLENGVTRYERPGNSTSGYTLPQMYHRPYQGLYDNTNPIPLNPLRVTNQVISMETDNSSGYDRDGYVGVLDYTGSLSTNQAVSMTTASVSGYTNPRSVTHGYVGVREYSFPVYLKIFPDRTVPMTRSVSGYTNPNSLIYGYVGATDYTGSIPPLSKSFVKRTISRTSTKHSGRTRSQVPYNRTQMLATSQP